MEQRGKQENTFLPLIFFFLDHRQLTTTFHCWHSTSISDEKRSEIQLPFWKDQNNDGKNIKLHIVSQIPRPQHTELRKWEPCLYVKHITPPIIRACQMIGKSRWKNGFIVDVSIDVEKGNANRNKIDKKIHNWEIDFKIASKRTENKTEHETHLSETVSMIRTMK